VLKSGTSIHTSFKVGNNIYVRERGSGISEVDSVGFVKIPGTELFADKRVFVLTPRSSKDWLIGTRDAGFFSYNPITQSVTELQTEADHLLRSNWLYGAVTLQPGLLALNTLGAGIILMTEDGHMLAHYPDVDGVGDSHITKLYAGKSGELWVGKRNSSVTVVRFIESVSKLSKVNGLEGVINGAVPISGEFVLPTNSGLHFVSRIQSDAPTSVMKVPEVQNAWDVAIADDGFLVAMDDGIGYVSSERRKVELDQPWSGGQVFVIRPDPVEKNLYWAGTKRGVSSFHFSNARIIVREEVDLGVEIRQLLFDDNTSRIWAIGQRDSIYVLGLDNGRHVINETDYLVKSSTPGEQIFATLVGSKVTYTTGLGIYRFRDEMQDFEALGEVSASIVNGDSTSKILSFYQAKDSSLWVALRDSVMVLSPGLGEKLLTIPTALKFSRHETSFMWGDEQGVMWLNAGSELIRYDPAYGHQSDPHFRVIITEVRQASNGSILFAGYSKGDDGGFSVDQSDWAIPTLSFELQNLSFNYSSSDFVNYDAVVFRHRIESDGVGGWSDWTEESEFMTTNLREGHYTVAIQAKDAIGRLSAEARYSFVILPPWYRTYWAYLAYLVLGIAALTSTRKYITMRREHKLAAEQAKELEREREVVKKLSEANDRLTQANKLKDEFLATTSHELRTPLTAILGFTSVLKDEIPQDAEYREFLDIIEDSGSRLMDTLNSLLDLAKLRAGIMDINLESLDLYQAVFQEVVPRQDAAAKKGLKLKVRRPDKQLFAMADMHGLGRIVHNLIGNAVKFTEEGSVEVWFAETSHHVEMHVTDTGIGIDEQFLPDLFDAFIQESDGLSRTYEGTGLGLAITSGIVQLMGASITVQSKKGEGSEFIVSFEKADGPRGRREECRAWATAPMRSSAQSVRAEREKRLTPRYIAQK
jgi:signal transduction histidine kinase